MSEQTLRLVDRLRQRLRHTLRRITLARLAFGGAVTLGVLAAAWLVSALVEAGFWLEPTPRSVIVGGVSVLVLACAGYFLVRPLLQLIGLLDDASEEHIAHRIGTAFPEVRDRLVNLLHLVEGRRSAAPDELVDEAVQRLGREVESVPFETMEDFSRARYATRLASLPIIGLLLFGLVAPSTFLDASERLMAPGTTFERPAPFQLTVLPGDVELVKGDSLAIRVQATGTEQPQTMTLALRNEGEEHVERIELQPDSTGTFTHTAVNVRQSLQYRVEAPPVQTNWYAATVQARPLVRTMQITVTPPAYTDLPQRRLDPNVGDVTGLPGTRVELNLALGGPEVEQAQVVFDNGETDSLALDRDRATGGFTLQRDGHYRIQLRSTEGIANRDPIRYSMKLRADARPSVVFLAPEADATLNEQLEQQLRLRVSDDFGFSRLRLHYRVAERRLGEGDTDVQSIPLELNGTGQLDQQVDYRWRLAAETGLDLLPGDVVEYYVQVWDNDAVAGYKSARTATQRLRLPSLAEQYEQLDAEQDQTQQDLEDMMEETESIEEQFNELRNELRRKQRADWEDERQLEQIKQRKESLESRVEQLSRQMEEMTREMSENNLVDPETTKMYEELQEVMEDINAPELMKALEELQQSMSDMNMKQMQEALENFEFNEQQYQQRLQRSLELFKKLRTQQKLDEAARRAEDLRKQQERLAEETSRRMEESPEAEDGDPSEDAAEDAAESASNEEDANNEGGESSSDEQRDAGDEDAADQQRANEDLAQEQERASEEMKQLQEELDEMREQMQEQRGAPTEQMQQMQQELEQKNLPEQMQQNSQQLRQNQMQKARQGQQQMQEQLQQLRQQLQQMQQTMSGQQMQINMAGLQSALENTLTLSEDQEALRRRLRGLSANSPAVRDLAQDQSSISEGVRTVSDSLRQLAESIPQMSRAVQRQTGEALRQMEQATSALTEREAQQASGYQKGSMMHLNELALMLADLLDQLMNSQGGGGGMSMQQMIQQMQEMSGQQRQLNQQIQQMLNDMQGNRLSVDQQERLQQMARQQAEIKKALEELRQQGQESGNQMLGDLEKIAEEMEKTIQELQQNKPNRRTNERQRRILIRMLDAQRSLQQQGQEEKRRSQQSEKDFTRQSPDALSPEEQVDRLRRDLIRALETGYAPDYEDLIKRYFELLQEQQRSEE